MKYPIYILILFVNLAFHPLHVSLANLDFQPGREVGILSVKLFSDDFRDVLKMRYGLEGDIEPAELGMKQAPIMTNYLRDNLKISLNGVAMPIGQWKLDSIAHNFEATWLYYSFEFKGELKELSVRNTIFFDSFTDQKNLMIIASGKKEKALQFTPRKPVSTLRFE